MKRSTIVIVLTDSDNIKRKLGEIRSCLYSIEVEDCGLYNYLHKVKFTIEARNNDHLLYGAVQLGMLLQKHGL